MKARLEGLIHDLNNVFTTMLDTADLLESDPEYAAVAAVLHRSVARGRRILEGFAESGVEPVELETVLAGAVEFARDFLRVGGADVEFRIRVEPGLALSGSGIAWERAFFNLLINAGQAMGGRGAVEVNAWRSGELVEITVADEGPGSPEDVLPRVFEPGFSTKPDRPGLGLRIAESIVRDSGGTITAGTRGSGRGALFRISVPAGAAALDGRAR